MHARRGGRSPATDTRWVSPVSDLEMARLTESACELSVRFGRHLGAAFLSWEGQEWVVLVGFDFEFQLTAASEGMEEVDLSIGHALLALDQLETSPIATPSETYNIVAASGKSLSGYEGHPFEDLSSLMPSLRMLSLDSPAVDDASRWAILTDLCAKECLSRDSWMEEGLVERISSLTSNPISQFPYESLGRSLFDLDPRSLFTSLYRCLEAMYSYERAESLRHDLESSMPWYQVADKLSDTLGWHPRHDSGLREVLAHASVSPPDLEALGLSLGCPPGSTSETISAAVRKLRNNIVHYGSLVDTVSVDDYKWNDVCSPLAGIVGGLFRAVYTTLPVVR